MNTTLLAIILMASATQLYAQTGKLDGLWQGAIAIKDKGTVMNVLFKIDDNRVSEFSDDFHAGKYAGSIESRFPASGDIYYFSSTISKAFSNETQSFTIIPIDQDKLQIKWLRKCSIYTIRKGTIDDV